MWRLLCMATAWTCSRMALTMRSTSCGGVTGMSEGVAIFTSMSKPTEGSTPCAHRSALPSLSHQMKEGTLLIDPVLLGWYFCRIISDGNLCGILAQEPGWMLGNGVWMSGGWGADLEDFS